MGSPAFQLWRTESFHSRLLITSLPLLYFPTLALRRLLRPPGCTACGPRGLCQEDICQRFLSLNTQGAPRRSIPNPLGIFLFLFRRGASSFGVWLQNVQGEKEKKGICCLPIRLMFIPAEHSTSLSPCKDSQGMLKKKKKSPTRATQKDFWTHSRDLWPNYFIYYISFFVILTTYIFTFKKWILKALLQGCFYSISCIYICWTVQRKQNSSR